MKQKVDGVLLIESKIEKEIANLQNEQNECKRN
jgi:hypothetical protein